MIKKMMNELISKYGKYVGVIINLDIDSLYEIYNMSTEEAISKLEELKQENKENSKKEESPQTLYYSQC